MVTNLPIKTGKDDQKFRHFSEVTLWNKVQTNLRKSQKVKIKMQETVIAYFLLLV